MKNLQAKLTRVERSQLSEYERLRRQVKKLRSQMRRYHRGVNYDDDFGRPRQAGLVMPTIAPSSRVIMSRYANWQFQLSKYTEAMKSGILRSTSARDGYLRAFRNILEAKFGTKFYSNVFGRQYNYDDNEEASTIGKGKIRIDKDFMESATGNELKAYKLYNYYLNMPKQKFMHMYENGYIQQLKYVYQELDNLDVGELSFIEEAFFMKQEYNLKYIKRGVNPNHTLRRQGRGTNTSGKSFKEKR